MKVNLLIIYLVSIWISLISFSQSKLKASSVAKQDFEYCDELKIKTTKEACQEAKNQAKILGELGQLFNTKSRELTPEELRRNLTEGKNKTNRWVQECKNLGEADTTKDLAPCLIQQMEKSGYFEDPIKFLEKPHYLVVNLDLNIEQGISVKEKFFLIFKMILQQSSDNKENFNLKLYSYNKLLAHNIEDVQELCREKKYDFCEQTIDNLENELLDNPNNWIEFVKGGSNLKIYKELEIADFDAYLAFDAKAKGFDIEMQSQEYLQDKGTKYVLKFEDIEKDIQGRVKTDEYTEKLLNNIISFIGLKNSAVDGIKDIIENAAKKVMGPIIEEYIRPIMSNKIKYLGFEDLSKFEDPNPSPIYIYPDKLGEKTYPIGIYNEKILIQILKAFKNDQKEDIKSFFNEN